ncbi:hypothetical protein [Mycobacterium sp. HM-7]
MRTFAVNLVRLGGPGLTSRLPAHDGAATPAALNPSTALGRVTLSLNVAGVAGPRAKNDASYSTGANDNADEQLAQEPEAQTETDPEAEPDTEKPETDTEADLQTDAQARRKALDLEAGDGRSVPAPDGEKDESRQAP